MSKKAAKQVMTQKILEQWDQWHAGRMEQQKEKIADLQRQITQIMDLAEEKITAAEEEIQDLRRSLDTHHGARLQLKMLIEAQPPKQWGLPQEQDDEGE